MKQALLTLALAAASATLAAAQPLTFTIDPTHSNATFAVKHMMISNVKGNFSQVAGTVVWDAANLAASRLEATVDVSSVDTRDAKRDAHLKSPDFFDAAKYPQMKFQSTAFTRKGGALEIAGTLTIRGVTKPVVLTVTGPTAPVKDPWGNTRLGASAATKVNRKDFGIVWNTKLDGGGVLVGDDVDITLDIELIQKK